MIKTFFLFFLLLLPNVYGIGISYNRDSLFATYKPGETVELQYYAVANGEKEIGISVSGTFAEYARFEKVIPVTGKMTPFTIKFVFPLKNPKPGVYDATVNVNQVNSGGTEQFAFIVGASIPLQIRVLDAEPYMELNRFEASAQQSKFINFILNGANYGEKVARNVKGKISIFYGDKFVTDIFTKEKDLASQESNEFTATFDTTKKKIGEYRAVGKLVYKNKETLAKETSFFVGDEKVVLNNYTNVVTNSSINRFTLNVMSQWNMPIDFTARILFLKNDKEINSFIFPQDKLQPWTPKEVHGFVDTTGFELGVYDINLTLIGGKKETTYARKISVIEGKPLMIKEIIKEMPNFISSPLVIGLFAAILVLIIINVVLIIVFTNRNKQNKAKNERFKFK